MLIRYLEVLRKEASEICSDYKATLIDEVDSSWFTAIFACGRILRFAQGFGKTLYGKKVPNLGGAKYQGNGKSLLLAAPSGLSQSEYALGSTINWPSRTTGAGVKSEPEKNDRRASDRFPIGREVRYKILNRKGADEVGYGKTINTSSNGVLFATDQDLHRGQRLELSISWPAQLNSTVALKLVARGSVVRSEEGRVAVEIHQHEFRTTKPASIAIN